MAAYLIVDLDIHDQAGFQSYRMRVSAIIAKHGGEYLVRGGEFEVIEGDWHPHRLTLFHFPNRRAIHDFFVDPEYAELRAIRKRTSTSIVVAVDGIE